MNTRTLLYNKFTFNSILDTEYYSNDETAKLLLNRDSNEISVLYWNIRSLVCNFDNLTNYLNQLKVKPDILALAETKITTKVNSDPHVDIHGYSPFIYRKSQTHFGGVGFYISNQLDYNKREDLNITDTGCDCETLFIEITSKHKRKQVFGILYRHPRPNFKEFTKHYEKLLIKLANEKSNYVIVGDFNIDYLRISKKRTVETFADMVYSSGAFMPINKATRVPIHTEKCCRKKRPNNKKAKKCKRGKASLIDHAYLNNLNLIKNIGININDMSDHYSLILILKTDAKRFSNNEAPSRRDYKKFNKDTFNADIKREYEKGCNENLSTNEKFELLQNVILKAINKNAPLRKLTRKEKNAGYKPWFNKTFADRINERNHLYFLIQKRNKTELINQYQILKKNLEFDLKKAEKDYYDAEFQKHKNDMKQTWKLINKVINKRKNKVTIIKKMKCENGDYVTDQEQICNILNSHFVKNGPTLARKIPVTNILATSFLKRPITSSVFMSPTDIIEIEDLIDKLKLGKACGLYGISSSFIKHGKAEIATILTKLINECIEKGYFPTCLKRALVVPIHKKDEKDIPDNYRPISLLPSISKLFEKVIYARFATFFKSNNILSEKQFGFRNKHSTQNALTHLTDFLAEKMDKSELSIAVFLDLAKAFETVNHQILLQKLHHYGVRGLPYELIKSYLSDRKQCVKCDKHYSVFMNIECGVPQGSILGPLLFLLYVNDLPIAVDLSTILFADDTCIVTSSKNVNSLIRNTNAKLKVLNQWFISNKLTVNFTKTKYLVFSGQSKKHFNGVLKMGTNTLTRVSNIKYLGLMIDDNLNWKSHVSYLSSKVSSCCNIMYKLRYLIPLKSCISVY